MAVIRFQLTVTIILFPMEEKLNRISPVLQFQNIFLYVLIAKEIICSYEKNKHAHCNAWRM